MVKRDLQRLAEYAALGPVFRMRNLLYTLFMYSLLALFIQCVSLPGPSKVSLHRTTSP